MSQRRVRSTVFLNFEMVRSIARSKGINSQTELNIAVLALRAREGLNKEGGTTKAGNKAWKGQDMETKHAEEIARVLGVNSYHDLQLSNGMSLWSQLRMGKSNRANILELEPIQRRGLFVYEEEPSDGDLKIAADDPWQLKLTLKDKERPNYHILALLRNEEKHQVIVPSAHNFPTYFNEETIYIPPVNKKPLRFDKNEGLGWREIIVIACRDNIFPVLQKTDDSYLDAATRDKIAALLMSESRSAHYVFDSVGFDLIQN